MGAQLVPHVDVVGDDRIDAIVACHDTVVLRAVEAELIDGWQINVGQQSMPFRVGYGLYRSQSLAASGLPALLRHKFWQSPEQEQVSGLKYVGLLLYASEHDDYRFSLQAGAESVGTVRPARWDNRRHLVVAERPVTILNGGVPFTVRAHGSGPCYLEAVLFLPELPAPSSFTPRLDRLSTRVVGPDVIELHGIASEPVAVTATATPSGRSGGSVTATAAEPYPLLVLPLRGLRPGEPYRISVTAREPGGEVAHATVEVPAAPAPESAPTAPVVEPGGASAVVAGAVASGRGPVPTSAVGAVDSAPATAAAAAKETASTTRAAAASPGSTTAATGKPESTTAAAAGGAPAQASFPVARPRGATAGGSAPNLAASAAAAPQEPGAVAGGSAPNLAADAAAAAQEPRPGPGTAAVEWAAGAGPQAQAGAPSDGLVIPIEVVDCGRSDGTGAARCRRAAPAGLPFTFAVPLPRAAIRRPVAWVSFGTPGPARAAPAAVHTVAGDGAGAEQAASQREPEAASGTGPSPPPAARQLAGGGVRELVEPAQLRVHARWPDGSARWVLLDVGGPGGTLPARGVVRIADASMAAGGPAGSRLVVGAASREVVAVPTPSAVAANAPAARGSAQADSGAAGSAEQAAATTAAPAVGDSAQAGSGAAESAEPAALDAAAGAAGSSAPAHTAAAERTVGSGAPPGDGLTWRHEAGVVTAGNGHLRVTLRRGGAGLFEQIEVRRGDGWTTVGCGGGLYGALGSGLPLASQPLTGVRITEAGSRRLVIRAELPVADPQGVVHLRATLLIHLYAHQPFLKLVQRLLVVSPLAGAAMHGDLTHLRGQPEAAADLDGAGDERASLLRLRSLELRLPWPEIAAAGSAGQELVAPRHGAPVRMVHEHDRGYRVQGGGEERTVPGHASGRFTVNSAAGACLLVVRDFWERYPKGLRCDPQAVAVELFPALAGAELPDYQREWHRLYFWLHRASGCYRLKVGSALTTELLFCFSRDPRQQATAADWFQGQLGVRPDFGYVQGTGVLEPLAAKADSPHPPYERMVDRALGEWLEHRASRHEVGFMNFGDTFKGTADSGGLWENNEYDAPYCHLVEFLRGGDPGWLSLGYEAARHLLDVDTCNYSRDPTQVGAQVTHMAGHVGGYLPPFFRNKMGGSATIPSHTWVQGPVLFYLLTGDPFAAEVLQHTARWMTANLRYFALDNARECGWQLTHLCALDRLGDDPRYLNAAAIIVERVLAAQRPGGGWERVLTASHGGTALPRPRGEAGFMVGVLLSALRRYHDLTGDARVAQAITGGVRWLVANTYDRHAGHFRYTSCATAGPGPEAQFSLQVLEGLADANRIAPDPEIEAILQRNLADIGLTGEELLGRPRVGKALTQEACYIPALLWALAAETRGP